MSEHSRGLKAWKEHTTAFDRVRSIAEGLDQPRTARYVAEEAAVSETTAHEHLTRLAEMNVIRSVVSEDATRYEPDPLYARFRTLRGLIDDHDHAELLELKADVQRELEELTDAYAVESPTELREQTAETEDTAETMTLIKDASDWELTRYHLSVINEAIEKYSEYTGHDGRVHA